MTSRTHMLAAAATAVIAFACFAGSATAGEGTPPPPGNPPPIPTIDTGATLTVPRNARPGKVASVALRFSGPAPLELRTDRVTCAFRLGAKSLQSAVRVSGGAATCTIRVPRDAAGKTVRGAMRVVLNNIALERSFSFKIARL